MGFIRRSRRRKTSDRVGKPDSGDDYVPELFPHVQEAVGHDRHGGHRVTQVHEIYKLEVAVIPTNQAMIRIDNHDMVYKTEAGSSMR